MSSTSGSGHGNPTLTQPSEEIKAHLKNAMRSQDPPQQKEATLDEHREGKGEGRSSSAGKQKSEDMWKTEGTASASGSKKRYM
jgi:hypothetical protein